MTYAPTAPGFEDAAETSRTAPPPPVKGGPVLLADCVTPIGDETLLSLLWTAWRNQD
ncbi:hypothetical protein ACG74X_02390 [Marivita sp. S0852]|uniref:hypothetical protein n=1 Tax=Marivita sp. S0852 TaxID=3373893 RepID=UPI0039829449